MIINKINNKYNQTFGSENYPIRPFEIKTNVGNLAVQELSESDHKIAAIYILNFLKENFPWWTNYLKNMSDFNDSWILKWVMDTQITAPSVKNSNTTILIGKNQHDEIKSFFSICNFDKSSEAKGNIIDKKTGHIPFCLLSNEYRSQGAGRILLDKLLNTADGNFTDIFLEAENKAVNFYKRAGFLELDLTNPLINKISDYILSERQDRDTITLMSKSLDAANPWWKRIIKFL